MAVKYLVSANGETHLPVTGDDGKPDHRLMGAAWAALHEGYRGNKYEGPNKSEAISKLTAMYKSEGMDTPGASASHGELENQWVPIFRSGKHTSAEGNDREYTEADLDHIVSRYNPDYHEAPVVVGHPKDNAPSFGWVRGLRRDGETLLAKFGEVNPDFERMVQTGAFKKRSASFYVKPDGFELRHVGFLGAEPPAVKGLAAIKFDEGEVASIEFQEGSMEANEKKLFEQFGEWLREKLGGAPAAASSFSEADVQKLITSALAPVLAKNAELEGKLTKQSTDFAERERKLQSGEHSGRVSDAVNKLRSAGRWVPAFEKMGLKVVFSELAKSVEVIEFGEGDAKQKQAALDILVSFIEKLPKIVPEGMVVTNEKVIEFKAPKTGANLPAQSQNSQQLHELTLDYQEKHGGAEKITYGDALSAVARQHPELTVAGGATAGAV